MPSPKWFVFTCGQSGCRINTEICSQTKRDAESLAYQRGWHIPNKGSKSLAENPVLCPKHHSKLRKLIHT